MGVAARSLDTKRRIINYYLERGAYPYTKSYLYEGLKNHFSTIGLVGMNEACLNAKWLKKDLTNKECLKWAEKVLDFMRNKLSDFQELYGCLFNLEATPAESTCYTLARKDKEKYPDIITAGKPGETPYYTNSSHLPVEKIDNIFDALDMEDNLQIRYTSGTVFHAFLGERLPSWESAANLVRTIAENYKLPYFTLSPTYSICKKHGYINGEVKVCPYCGEETEIYSRITGYYRPVSNWNAGKTQEFEDRKTYNMNKLDKLESNNIDNTDKAKTNIVANDIVKQNNDLDINILELATTHTCPNCTLVKHMLDDKCIKYDTIYVDDDIEYAKSHDILSVPVLFTGSDRYDGAGNIIKYISGVCN
jgi:ribonucleoside-triphosphate reductase